MPNKILTLPKAEFDKHFSDERFKLNPHVCFISVLDCDNDEKRYDETIDNFLQVKVWDVEEDLYENDELKYKKPDKGELKRIVDFVNKHSDKKVFVVHCSAGISRSGAVATFIFDKFRDKFDKEQFRRENRFIQPNLYILNQLKLIDEQTS